MAEKKTVDYAALKKEAEAEGILFSSSCSCRRKPDCGEYQNRCGCRRQIRKRLCTYDFPSGH